MKKIILQRLPSDDECTTGVMIFNYRAFCLTLEPPWAGNKTKKSCIPPGVYFCEKRISPKRGFDVWWVLGVPDRTDEEIHPGNTADETEGCPCILVGNNFEPLNGKQAVLGSQSAWNELNRLLGTDMKFILDIRHYQI